MPTDINELGWKEWIAIYAATISTLTAFWRIYEFFDDKKGRIKIRILKVLPGGITEHHDELDKKFVVPVLITNIGKKNRHLKTPYFTVSPAMSIPDHSELMMNEVKNYLPKLLQPGEEFVYNIPMWLLVKYKKAGAKKVRAEITDTHTKLYESEWVEL